MVTHIPVLVEEVIEALNVKNDKRETLDRRRGSHSQSTNRS